MQGLNPDLLDMYFPQKELMFLLRNKFVSNHHMPAYHFHEGYEVYYSLSGEKNYFIKDKVYRISKGDLLFINAYELHRTTSTRQLERERFLLYINKHLFEQKYSLLEDEASPFRNEYPVLSLTVGEQAVAERLLGEMHSELCSGQRCSRYAAEGLLLEFLVFAIRCNERRQLQASGQEKTVHHNMMRIVRYINEHIEELLTLEAMSAQFFISPSHLSRVFKKTTGFSFVEYVVAVRIKEAQRMLRETGDSVNQVAERTGFSSPAQFFRQFRKISGSSPLQYRKRFAAH